MAGAVEVRAFEVTCPPGVTSDAPQVTDLDMPVRTVLSIKAQVPPGPLSAMGFAIGAAGVPIIPYDSSVFIVTDDATFDWTLPGQINSGAWQVQMYNTGQYPHTVYLYFTVELPDQPVAPATTTPIISAANLGSNTPVTPVTIPAPPPLELVS